MDASQTLLIAGVETEVGTCQRHLIPGVGATQLGPPVEVRRRVPFFSVVYFSGGTLPTSQPKRGKRAKLWRTVSLAKCPVSRWIRELRSAAQVGSRDSQVATFSVTVAGVWSKVRGTKPATGGPGQLVFLDNHP